MGIRSTSFMDSAARAIVGPPKPRRRRCPHCLVLVSEDEMVIPTRPDGPYGPWNSRKSRLYRCLLCAKAEEARASAHRRPTEAKRIEDGFRISSMPSDDSGEPIGGHDLYDQYAAKCAFYELEPLEP